MKIARRIVLILAVMAMLVAGLVIPASAADPTDANSKWEKVTSTNQITSDGLYLIVYEAGNLIFNGSYTDKLDKGQNRVKLTSNISEDHVITGDYDEYAFTIDVAAGTIKSASGFYMGATSNSNSLLSNKNTKYTNDISIDASGNFVVKGSGGAFLRYNASSGSTNERFRYYKSSSYTSQKAIQLYKLVEAAAPEVPTDCTHTSLTAVPAKAPTCSATGNKAYWQCADCNKLFADSAAATETTLTAVTEQATGAHVDANNDFKCDNTGCTAGVEPPADTELTLTQAIELGKVFGSTYTTNKYYITCTIVDVYNTQYGNANVVDDDGNEFVVYGMYSADGTTRYDAMAAADKPVAGNTVKFYGVIGAYNSNPQMKNGWVAEILVQCDHENVSTVTNPATCTTPGSMTDVCDDCGITLDVESIPALGHSYVNGTCACGEEFSIDSVAESGWVLVTDANDLQVGDQIVIVAFGKDYALGTTQNDNNRKAVAITKNGNVVEIGDDVQVITLKAGTVDGTFGFYTGAGYLYAASSSANHLKTQASNNANGSWKIVIDATNGKATINAPSSSNRSLLQYNPNETNNNPLFACYGSATQTAVMVYKWVEPTGDIELPTLDGVSLNMGSDLDMNIYATLPEAFANAEMSFKLGENGETVTVKYDAVKGRYTFEGITPNDLAEKVTMTLTVELGDNTYTLTKSYSILDYCAKYAEKAADENMMKLLAALMVYGDETRAYNKLAATATALLDGAYVNYRPVAVTPESEKYTNSKNYLEVFAGAYLVLNNKVDVVVRLTDAAYAENVEIWIGGEVKGEKLTSGYEIDGDLITIKDVRATEYNTEIIVKANGETLYYSVNMYCVGMANDAEVGDLVVAIYNYGKAAEAYVASKSAE